MLFVSVAVSMEMNRRYHLQSIYEGQSINKGIFLTEKGPIIRMRVIQ